MAQWYIVRVKRKPTREEREDQRVGFIQRPMLCTSQGLNHLKEPIVRGYVFFEPGDVNDKEEDYLTMEFREFTISKMLPREGLPSTFTEGFITKSSG
jgi:hypothetical protein